VSAVVQAGFAGAFGAVGIAARYPSSTIPGTPTGNVLKSTPFVATAIVESVHAMEVQVPTPAAHVPIIYDVPAVSVLRLTTGVASVAVR